MIKWPHFYLVDETSEPSTTCGKWAWMLKDRMSRSMPRSSWWVDSRNDGIWTDLRTTCTWSKSFQNPFKPALYTRTSLMKWLAFCGNDELSVIVAKAWGWSTQSTPSWEPRPCVLAHLYHPGKSSSACCKVCCACHPCEIVKGAPTDVWSVNVCTRIVSQSVKEALHALYQIQIENKHRETQIVKLSKAILQMKEILSCLKSIFDHWPTHRDALSESL